MSETGTRYVGAGVTRVDALEKVTGQAVYGVDVQRPGMLHGAVDIRIKDMAITPDKVLTALMEKSKQA